MCFKHISQLTHWAGHLKLSEEKQASLTSLWSEGIHITGSRIPHVVHIFSVSDHHIHPAPAPGHSLLLNSPYGEMLSGPLTFRTTAPADTLRDEGSRPDILVRRLW